MPSGLISAFLGDCWGKECCILYTGCLMAYKSSAVTETCDRLATTDMGRKEGWVPSPSNTMSPGPSLPPYQVASWSIQPFGHNRRGPKIGGSALFFGRGLDPHTTQCHLGRAYLPTKWHLDPSSHVATTDMGQKLGGLCPFGGGGAGSPSNAMWPGPRPTCMPSFILIHPTVWPQCTNVTDRTDKQWSDSIGRTVL